MRRMRNPLPLRRGCAAEHAKGEGDFWLLKYAGIKYSWYQEKAKLKEANGMYLGENIKKLGFGFTRLPKKGDIIDVEQVKVMVESV